MSRSLARVALRTATVYGGVAAVWILLPDRALDALVPDPALVTRLQTGKGWAFVAVTAVLLYAALRDTQARVRAMALLHEALYRSGDLARANLAAYICEVRSHR